MLEATTTKNRAIETVSRMMQDADKFTVEIQNQIQKKCSKSGYDYCETLGRVVTITIPEQA